MKSRVSKIILGTVQFGLNYGISNKAGQTSIAEAHRILEVAESAGISYLDTAAAYGSSEEVIGSYFERNPESKFKVISKLSRKEHSHYRDSLNLSLKRLNKPQLDILLFHSYADFDKNKTQLDEVLEDRGRYFNELGVSVYTNEELERLAEYEPIKVVQAPFNLLDNANKRKESLELCRKSGKAVHTRSAFLQGLFFLQAEKLPVHLQALAPYLNHLNAIAKDENVPMGALALNYAMSRDYIDGVLIGVDSAEQLRENLEWTEFPVSSEAYERVEAIEIQDERLINPSLWEKLK